MPTEFADSLAASLAGYGERPCIEFKGQWYSGDEVTSVINRITEQLTDAGVNRIEPVGLVVRNRVPHAAAILGSIAGRRPVVMIYSYQSAESIARDIAQLQLPAVLLDREDWTAPVAAAVEKIGCAAIGLSTNGPTVEVLARPRPVAGVAPDPALADAGLHILSSGTTGPPKRVAVRTAVLAHTVLSMTLGQTASPDDPPDLVFWPFGSVGVCQLLAGPYAGKRTVLLEKFSVAEWVRAVKTYQITWTGVQPTILRMLVEADVPKADLESLQYLPGGSGPLELDLQEAFERKYGIPLLWAYGATEFAGSVCAWTPDLYREFGAAKSGSVGRPLPGVTVRIVDPDTGDEVRTGERGFLTARVDVIGPEFVSTTDLASVDSDRFVTIHGRGDGAINRGGFKILPETVRRVLVSHPAVRDACVVGVPDRRLGEVPFAAIETSHQAPAPTPGELQDWMRAALPSHHVPVAVAVVESLPRNAAMKVIPAEVAALYRAMRET